MRDITTIDWKAPHGKIRSLNPGKQKVWYTQEGVEYGSDGKACNAAQVKKYYETVATDAQRAADEAKEASIKAQATATEMMKNAGMNKTAVKKAVAG